MSFLKNTPNPVGKKLGSKSSKKFFNSAYKNSIKDENTIKKSRRIEKVRDDVTVSSKQSSDSGTKRLKSGKKIEALKMRKIGISTHIICMAPELNPSIKEDPFELADDTAYERSRYSHNKIGKYSTVMKLIRTSKGNTVEKRISVNISQHDKFGKPSFNRIFEDFFIIGVENK
jgi:hypothetical protein